MNFKKSILFSVILFIALFFLFSCATTPQVQHVSDGQIIDMGSYMVAAPPGKDWEVKTEKEKGSIQF